MTGPGWGWVIKDAALPRMVLPHQLEEQAPYANVAPWIRGRVFKVGPTWHMEVVNTATGKVLASDNTNNHATILTEAQRVTAVARGTWDHQIRRRDCTAKRPR